MQDNNYANISSAQASQIDIGLRRYMLGVYNHMTNSCPNRSFVSAMKWAALQYLSSSNCIRLHFQYVVMFAPFALVMYLSFKLINYLHLLLEMYFIFTLR